MEQRVETSDRTVGNFVLFWMLHHYSYHLSCISHEINNFQKCCVQGRHILHFIDLFILRALKVIALKKITCEGDSHILLAGGFLFESIHWRSEMWIHNIIDRSNGKCGGWPKKKASVAKSKCWISCRFYFPKSELLRKVWLMEGWGGEDDSSPGGSSSYNSCTVATIWPYFCARGNMAFASLFTIFILCLSWLI